MAVSRALKLSAAFGGANAVVAYECGAPSTPAERTRSPVVVTGAGVVGASGALRLSDVLALREKRSIGPCREVDLDAFGVDARRLDRSARWLTAATALALSAEGLREGMERTGLFVAATRMPEQSSRRCTDSIRQRGIAGTSASAFARMSVNSPTGACSHALGLLGPTSTFSIGEGSGLLALALAAEWLAWREDASRIVAGGVNELSGQLADEAEGAACVALMRSPVAEPGTVVVAGWGIAGPDRAREAAERAMTGLGPVDGLVVDCEGQVGAALNEWTAPRPKLGVVEASRLWGASEATRSCAMAAVAAAHIAAGHARSILLVAARGASSVALVLEGKP